MFRRHFCYVLLLGRRRDSRGFSNGIAISVLIVYDAEPLRNLPRWLELVEFGRIYPSLCVRLGVVHDDLQFQGVMIQAPVAFRKAHLIAARTPKNIAQSLSLKPIVSTTNVSPSH